MIDNLKISNVTTTSVSLKWDNLGCKDPEGLISEFKVVYEVWPESTAARTTFVSGRNVTEITIEELIPGTQYKIGVAAVYLYTSSLSKFSYAYKTTGKKNYKMYIEGLIISNALLLTVIIILAYI